MEIKKMLCAVSTRSIHDVKDFNIWIGVFNPTDVAVFLKVASFLF